MWWFLIAFLPVAFLSISGCGKERETIHPEKRSKDLSRDKKSADRSTRSNRSGKSSKSRKSSKSSKSGKSGSKSSSSKKKKKPLGDGTDEEKKKSSSTKDKKEKSSKSGKSRKSKSSKSSKSSKNKTTTETGASSKSSKKSKDKSSRSSKSSKKQTKSSKSAALLADTKAASVATSTLPSSTANQKHVNVVDIVASPQEVHYKAVGGIHHVTIANNTNERRAFKVKCSDIGLYRVNPVFGFLEPGAERRVDVLRGNGAVKVDKLVFVTQVAGENASDPKEVLSRSEENATMVVPLIAQ